MISFWRMHLPFLASKPLNGTIGTAVKETAAAEPRKREMEKKDATDDPRSHRPHSLPPSLVQRSVIRPLGCATPL